MRSSHAYHAAKRRAGALDFSDLIAKTRNLLSRSDAAQWVLYKLDRRVEHILVDEAQDTSPDQWLVVKAIAEDFFSGEGAARAPRTIFAVGDDKQSIFRFQGAVPAMLSRCSASSQKRIEERDGSPSSRRPLYLSFRSTREVLSAVDTVFERELAGEDHRLDLSRPTPRTAPTSPGTSCSCRAPCGRSARSRRTGPSPTLRRAPRRRSWPRTIADEDSAGFSGTLLPSGKRLRDGEILILVRRRDAFAAAMNRALLARGIATAGADRIPVSTHIAVLDLLALADVMLLPEDDLQLAAF